MERGTIPHKYMIAGPCLHKLSIVLVLSFMFLQATGRKDASFSIMSSALILTWHIAGILTVLCGSVKAARHLDVYTPQQFMDAVRSLKNNEELFIQIQAPYLQLRDDLLLLNASEPVTNGDLTIIGKQCTAENCTYPLTVLDLGGLSSCTVRRIYRSLTLQKLATGLPACPIRASTTCLRNLFMHECTFLAMTVDSYWRSGSHCPGESSYHR